MGPLEAFTTAWRKSFTYGGRATRAEYWWFYLINIIIALVLGYVVMLAYEAFLVLLPVYVIAQVFPTVSITIRRLRDAGKEWIWIFINLVPIIGGFWFLYLMVQPSVVV